MLELLRTAENPNKVWTVSASNPADNVLDAQLYFILTTLLEENLMEKVETVENGEGLRLRRLTSKHNLPFGRCSVEARIRVKESIVWKSKSDSTHQEEN